MDFRYFECFRKASGKNCWCHYIRSLSLSLESLSISVWWVWIHHLTSNSARFKLEILQLSVFTKTMISLIDKKGWHFFFLQTTSSIHFFIVSLHWLWSSTKWMGSNCNWSSCFFFHSAFLLHCAWHRGTPQHTWECECHSPHPCQTSRFVYIWQGRNILFVINPICVIS